MQITDRHFRAMARTLSRKCARYTERVNANAVRLSRDDVLAWEPAREGYVVCQLGGNEPKAMAEAAAIARARGYREVNINCGCPSDRVEKGCFGASLMFQPDLVAAMVRACVAAVDDAIPITVKCRLGALQKNDPERVNFDFDRDYPPLLDFVRTVTDAGCSHVILHTRKAVLGGLSTDANRRVPRLCREAAWKLATDLPHVAVTANGEFRSLEECEAALAAQPDGQRSIAGVMVGRAACSHPWALLGGADDSPILRCYCDDREEHVVRSASAANGLEAPPGQPRPPPPAALASTTVYAMTRRAAIAACASHCARELACEYDLKHRNWVVPTPSEQQRMCTVLLKPLLHLLHGRGSKKVKAGMWTSVETWCKEQTARLGAEALAEPDSVVRALRKHEDLPRERIAAARVGLPLFPVEDVLSHLVAAHLTDEWLDAEAGRVDALCDVQD